MKKFLILLLALTMCIVMLPSCKKNKDPVPPAPQPLSVVADGASEYTIVYAKSGSSWEKTVASRLSTAIRKATGVKLEVVADTESAADVNKKEIVIGTANNNRSATYTRNTSVNKGYAIFVDGARLIFDVGSQTGGIFAIYQFVKDQFGVDMENGETLDSGTAPITVAPTYAAVRELNSADFPYMGIDIENFYIASTGEYLMNSLSVRLKDLIQARTNVEIGFDRISNGFEPNNGYFVLNQDDSLENGAFSISVSGNLINVNAGDYHGFDAAITALTTEYNHSDGYYTFRDGMTKNDNHISYLDKFETSAKYTYDRRGEYRVMFYNVLFYSSTGTRKDSNGRDWNDVPVKDRNRLQAILIAEYMPDVLGCQEFNVSKRDQAGSDDLSKLLEKLGYAETVDPRVDNASHPILGSGGAPEVTVGDKTFKTFYNATPLFYNTKTTKHLDGAYYWYKNQWDQEGIGGTHELAANDCASKSATWGLFESLETREKYIVISTHMCSANDYIRGLQAQELVALISELVATYNVPVFLGGDMNGNIGDSNYDLFVGDAGYKSLQDYRDPDTKKTLATEFTSLLNTCHGYPIYDRNDFAMTPGNGSLSNISLSPNRNSIDQIFVTNEDTADIKVFGVIADFCARRGSDHLPLMVDFSINK